MTKYTVKSSGIIHKGAEDIAAKPYAVGDTIELNDKDAELLKDYLAGESEAIELGELVPAEKMETEVSFLKTTYETKLNKMREDKNAKIDALKVENSKLKEMLAIADAELTQAKKELATAKGLNTKAQNKINELEKKLNKGE